MHSLCRSLLAPVLFGLVCLAGVAQDEVKPKDEKKSAAPKLITELKTDQGQKVVLTAEHDPWADRVVRFHIGKPAPKGNRNPQAAVGKPDRGTRQPGATSVSLGHGGVLVLEFVDNALFDGPGDDLVIFEIGNAIEATHVEISEDGKTWLAVGRVRGAKSTLDISAVAKPGRRYYFVKLTDAKQGRSNGSKTPGADIDAVGALNSVAVVK